MFKKICLVALAAVFALSFTACAKKTEYKVFTEYKISADLDTDKMQLEAVMTVKFKNTTDKALEELKFNLYPNAFREGAKNKAVSDMSYACAYPEGPSYGDMLIKDVSQNEKPSEYSVAGEDENILCVVLEKTLYPNEKAELEIAFTLNLARVNHRTGYNAKTVNLGYWYPSLCVDTNNGWYESLNHSWGDAYFAETADFEVALKVKSSYTVAATGEFIGVSEEPNFFTYQYTAKSVRDFAFVLSEDFNIATSKFMDTTINYYYLDDENFENTVNAAKQSIEFFSEAFGNYPYPTMSVVQAPFFQHGAEFSSLIIISDSLSGDEVINTVVHENAHQWWYNLIGNNQSEYGWLDEGLAELSSLMFFERYKDYGLTPAKLTNGALAGYRAFYNEAANIHKKADTSMKRSVKDFGNEFEYINIAYNKSLLMLSYARDALGSKKFDNALKNYAQSFWHRNAAPEDFIGFFEKTRLNTTDYFYSWIEGKVLI